MPSAPATTTRAQVKKRKKRLGFWRGLTLLIAIAMTFSAALLVWFFLTPSGTRLRYTIADSLLTTQHRHWAKYVIGERGLRERIAAYAAQFEKMGEEKDETVIRLPGDEAASSADQGGEDEGPDKEPEPLTKIEPVEGEGFKGYLLTVRDPKNIRLVVPNKRGRGEKVSSMVKRTGALAGVNAGGFSDPNGKGDGFRPIGLVISQGKVYYNGLEGEKRAQIVGLSKEGRMIAGHYSLEELEELNVSEAVSFEPRLIVNGKGLIPSRELGWGIAPRTVMGQREDGAVLLLVIDGRQPGYSLGATLYDAQEIMLAHGAVIAANLDGGSSTVLAVEGGQVVNRPASRHGERDVPTAFLVFDDPSDVVVPNIWAGLEPDDLDPGRR